MKEAVKVLCQSGVSVKMITGDGLETASAIGKQGWQGWGGLPGLHTATMTFHRPALCLQRRSALKCWQALRRGRSPCDP